jgi:chromosome segregation ATPase
MGYSLAQAAKAVGKTRQALQYSIKNGIISANKNALGYWEIDPAELHRVYPLASKQVAEAGRDFQPLAPSLHIENKALQAKLETMQELCRSLEDETEDLKQQRDDWKEQARAWQEQASRARPAPGPKLKAEEQQNEPIQPRSLWAYFFPWVRT